MNDLARGKLVEAALNGVPQIRATYQSSDGLCGLGVLGYRLAMGREAIQALDREMGLDLQIASCPECGEKWTAEPATIVFSIGRHLVTHLNDDHHMDFLTIARKMP